MFQSNRGRGRWPGRGRGSGSGRGRTGTSSPADYQEFMEFFREFQKTKLGTPKGETPESLLGTSSPAPSGGISDEEQSLSGTSKHGKGMAAPIAPSSDTEAPSKEVASKKGKAKAAIPFQHQAGSWPDVFKLDNINQVLYPPRYNENTKHTYKVFGQVYIRQHAPQEQFPLQKEIRQYFTKGEIAAADTIWNAAQKNLKIEFRQGIFSMLSALREYRGELQKLRDSKPAGENFYSNAASDINELIFERVSFEVSYIVPAAIQTNLTDEDILALTVAKQLNQELEVIPSVLINGYTACIPRMVLEKDDQTQGIEVKKLLFRYGFIQYAKIWSEDSMTFLPKEAQKVLKVILKGQYPVWLEGWNIQKTGSPDICILRITEGKCYSMVDPILKVDIDMEDLQAHQAALLDDVASVLSSSGDQWWTAYSSPSCLIQTEEIYGEKVTVKRKSQKARQIVLPCSIPQLSAISLSSEKRVSKDTLRMQSLEKLERLPSPASGQQKVEEEHFRSHYDVPSKRKNTLPESLTPAKRQRKKTLPASSPLTSTMLSRPPPPSAPASSAMPSLTSGKSRSFSTLAPRKS